MSNEYKESLKEDLQHLYEIPTGVWKYKEKLSELDEVYAKARAFDDILKVFESAPTKEYAHLIAIYELNKEYTFGGNGRDKEYKSPENIDVDKWWRELREENK